MPQDPHSPSAPLLRFHGGFAGALAPVAVFLTGVAYLGLSGAPDERGFWPVLLGALGVGVLLARDSRRYCEEAVAGMARPLVLTMVMAWLLAGVLGSVVRASGLVELLAVGAVNLGLQGGLYAVAAFGVAAAVSTGTGTSLGTLILCVPVLLPVGPAAGTSGPVLLGAILGGATFGDNISPVSDTTIASATTQDADLGGVVRSRLRYALPAAAVATLVYAFLGGGQTSTSEVPGGLSTTGAALWVGLGPVVAIALLFRRRHLVESLLAGAAVALLAGLLSGSITGGQIMTIDQDAFLARGLILDGMERAIGITVFTLLLMGVVAGVEASGVVTDVVRRFEQDGAAAAVTRKRADWTAFGSVSMATLLTTHSVVAILAVGRIVRDLGERSGLSRYRRANVLDVTVCTYPFLLPFFIPTVLASSLSGTAAGLRVSPLQAGLHNAHSWALLAILLVALITGWGRAPESGRKHDSGPASPERATQ